MNKIKLLLLSCSLICCSHLFAQEQIEVLEIKKVLALQESAWNNARLDSFMMFYWNSPELRFVSKKGISRGWQQVYDNYKKSYAGKEQMGKLGFVINSVDMVNNINAIVVGSWKVTNASGTHEGYFTLWFKKINDNWYIILDHTS